MKCINSTVVVTNREEERYEQELQVPELSLFIRRNAANADCDRVLRIDRYMCFSCYVLFHEFAICQYKDRG